jgi:hypothetical protein
MLDERVSPFRQNVILQERAIDPRRGMTRGHPLQFISAITSRTVSPLCVSRAAGARLLSSGRLSRVLGCAMGQASDGGKLLVDGVGCKTSRLRRVAVQSNIRR